MGCTKNSHFISKFLLQPWEFKKGKVRILNYATESFEDCDSETLFSKENLFSQEEENFFNKHIETINRQELLNIKKMTFKKKKNRRAIILFLWDLIGRYTAAKKGDRSAVERFVSMSEKQLDEMTDAIESKYTTLFATTPSNGRLCFPSNLLLFFIDEKTGDCGFGFPINGTAAILSVPKGFDEAALAELAAAHFFCNISAGTLATDFVVVHPDLFSVENLIPLLVQQRRDNQELATQVGSMRAKVKEMYGLAGLS